MATMKSYLDEGNAQHLVFECGYGQSVQTFEPKAMLCQSPYLALAKTWHARGAKQTGD